MLEGFGVEAQQKLKAASVLVVGAGGLGCPALQYLASAGVGRIGIIDNDLSRFQTYSDNFSTSLQMLVKASPNVQLKDCLSTIQIFRLNLIPKD